jgi:serine/threonine protein kinase
MGANCSNCTSCQESDLNPKEVEIVSSPRSKLPNQVLVTSLAILQEEDSTITSPRNDDTKLDSLSASRFSSEDSKSASLSPDSGKSFFQVVQAAKKFGLASIAVLHEEDDTIISPRNISVKFKLDDVSTSRLSHEAWKCQPLDPSKIIAPDHSPVKDDAIATPRKVSFNSKLEDLNASRFSSETSNFESLDPNEIFFEVDAAEVKDDISDLHSSLKQQNILVSRQDVKLNKWLCTTMKSTIYMGTWKTTPVAIKMVKDPKQGNVSEEDQRNSLRELLHEIRLLNKIHWHPNVVQFIGASFDSGQCWFLQEYMDGGDVESYLIRMSAHLGRVFYPPRNILLKWTTAIASALSFLHGRSQPILHRDLKPLNLLLNRSLNLKVTDFGIAKQLPSKAEIGDNAGYKMTGGVGTWRYMAPEVVRYQQYTDRIDIYSFSLIMYRIATGLQPFHKMFGKDTELILKAFVRGEEPRPKLPAEFMGALPQGFDVLMQDAWHVVPEKRPSASECILRLAEIKEKELDSIEGIRSSILTPIKWVRSRSGLSGSNSLSPKSARTPRSPMSARSRSK